MRYPTDPVTGATIYDQGMIEVEIESEKDVEEVAEDAADQATETAESSEGAVEKSNVQMRYPTDPVTGATIYDQGMIEVEIESENDVEEVAEVLRIRSLKQLKALRALKRKAMCRCAIRLIR